MKTVIMVPSVDPDKCIGCGFCTTRCIFGAITVDENRKASVHDESCMCCMGCFDICPNMAISIKMLEQPYIHSTDTEDVDHDEIAALCRKVNRDPERVICHCTHTKATEVAASIIKGARTVAEVGLMTGIKSSCRLHCTMPVIQMLEAYGCMQKSSDNNHTEFFKCEISLDKITDEIVQKYPQYYLKEDLEIMKQNELPFLPEMF